MIEELKDEELIRKIGGRFKLSALIQKRLVALNKGSRSVISGEHTASTATKDKLHTVIQEILHDKIFLDTETNVKVRDDADVDRVLDNLSDGF